MTVSISSNSGSMPILPSLEGLQSDEQRSSGSVVRSVLASIQEAVPSNIQRTVSNAGSSIRSSSGSRYLASLIPSTFGAKSRSQSGPPSLEHARSAVLEKADSKGLDMPDFRGKSIEEGKTVTIIMHGTGQSQDKDQVLSRAAIEASKNGGDVIVLNGIGTSSKKTDAYQQDFKAKVGQDSTLMPSHGFKNNKIRTVRQNLMGSGIFNNAHSVIQQLSQMEKIPEHINIVGFSRGGVTATVTAALLDTALHTSGESEKHPKMKMVLFDPVAGLGKNKDLYSRDMLANNPQYTESNTLVFKSATDTRAHFLPQKGAVSEQESPSILAANHSGIEGKSLVKPEHQHHHEVSLITERMTFDILGFASETGVSGRLSDANVVRASLKLGNVQKGILEKAQAKASKSFNPAMRMRDEGKELLNSVRADKLSSKLFVSPQVKEIFAAQFPEHAKIIKRMERAEALGGKAPVAGMCTLFDQTSSSSGLSREEKDLVNEVSTAIKEWAGVEPVGIRV